MHKDNRKFIVFLNGTFINEEIAEKDFDRIIRDFLDEGYDPEEIRVWTEASFRLTPDGYEVD